MKQQSSYAGDLEARIHKFLYKKFAQFPDLRGTATHDK